MQACAKSSPPEPGLMRTHRPRFSKLPCTRPMERWTLFCGRQPRLMSQNPCIPRFGLHQLRAFQFGQALNLPGLFPAHGPPFFLDVPKDRLGARLRQPPFFHGIRHVSPNLPLHQGLNVFLGVGGPNPQEQNHHAGPVGRPRHGRSLVWRSQVHHHDPPWTRAARRNNTPNASRRDPTPDLRPRVDESNASLPKLPDQLSVH